MSTLVEVCHLGKHFGSIKAVDDISFEVRTGEVLGFLGPNGAGKSTTMKMLTCFITPDFGTARVGGQDIQTDSLAVRQKIGYLPESAPSYEDMGVAEFLKFIAAVRGLTGTALSQRLDAVYQLVGLEPVLPQRIGTLSKGFKRRVSIAQALIHDPPVLIMDEPTDGLDPNQKFDVRQLIRKMAEDKVIILSTHILEEVDAVCSRAIIIADGQIKADDTPEGLKSSSPDRDLATVFRKITLGDG